MTILPVSLIGVPTDVGAGTRGASMGPEALRVAGIDRAIARFGVEVKDCGNLSGPTNPDLPAVNGFRHMREVVAWNRSVHAAVHAELKDGRLPIMLGGDHCLAIGSISAVARHCRETGRHLRVGDHCLAIGSISAVARHCRETGRHLRVLWFDAHADFNTATMTPSGNIHGMPGACLCGHGPSQLTEIGGHVPAMSPQDIREIGIRSVDEGEKRLLAEIGIEVFDMRYVDEVGMRQTMEQALAGVGPATHLHVSLDVDFLDPEIAPGVGTTVRGGPTYREAQLCMEMIADTGQLCSLDIVELNPALDLRNMTAELAVDLVESLFGKSTLMRMHK